MDTILKEQIVSEVTLNVKNILINFLADFKKNDESVQVLSRKEACKFLGISLKTLSNYMDAGILKAKKINGRVFLLKEDLKEVLSNSSR